MSHADDRPWTEQQWEAFMKRADLRAARFGELLETLHNHPDCEMEIAREMGWEDPPASDADSPPLDVDEANSAAMEELEKASDPSSAPRDEMDEVREIPVYRQAMDCAQAIHLALKPLVTAPVPEGEDPDEDLSAAWSAMQIAAAKIAAGHGMGYEDDVLCGNIVCCRLSHTAAGKCVDGLRALCRRGILPAVVLDPLIAQAQEVERGLKDRIAELRLRVWW